MTTLPIWRKTDSPGTRLPLEITTLTSTKAIGIKTHLTRNGEGKKDLRKEIKITYRVSANLLIWWPHSASHKTMVSGMKAQEWKHQTSFSHKKRHQTPNGKKEPQLKNILVITALNSQVSWETDNNSNSVTSTKIHVTNILRKRNSKKEMTGLISLTRGITLSKNILGRQSIWKNKNMTLLQQRNTKTESRLNTARMQAEKSHIKKIEVLVTVKTNTNRSIVTQGFRILIKSMTKSKEFFRNAALPDRARR